MLPPPAHVNTSSPMPEVRALRCVFALARKRATDTTSMREDAAVADAPRGLAFADLANGFAALRHYG